MKVTTYRCKLTFLYPVLGTRPNTQIGMKYLADKFGIKPPQEEVDTLPDAVDTVMTKFVRNSEEKPCLYTLHIVGFLRETAEHTSKLLTPDRGRDKGKGYIPALKSKVERNVFVTPVTREKCLIELHLPPGGEIEPYERTIRRNTFSPGPAMTIGISESAPEGTWCEFGILVENPEITESILRQLLDRGERWGLGQHRSSQMWGTFTYELTPEDAYEEQVDLAEAEAA